MCWAVDPLEGTLGSPLGGIWLIESPPPVVAPVTFNNALRVLKEVRSKSRRGGVDEDEEEDEEEDDKEEEEDEDEDEEDEGDAAEEAASVRWLESYPDIRGLAWSPSGRHALATTAQGSVWRIALDGDSGGGGGDDEDEESEGFAGETTAAETTSAAMSVILRGHDSALTCVTWSPRRGSVSGGGSMYATGAASGRVVIWDADARRELAAFDAGGAVRSIAFSPDGAHLAAGLDGGVVNVFKVFKRAVVSPRFHTTTAGGLRAAVGALAYSPDGAFLAAGDQLGGLELHRVPGGYERRARCLGHASAVLHADWSADSRVVRTGSTSRETLHHDAPSGRRLTKTPRYHVDAREPRVLRDSQDEDVDDLDIDGDNGDAERGGWHTWTSPLGFELMGVWPRGADGTDINGVWRSARGGAVQVDP
jgi:WD40 repeat protein